MVNVVATTQCGHLPDPYNMQVLASGIKTWHTDLLYGGVSFAIISDRLFKSGPDKVRKVSGRKDHIKRSEEHTSELQSLMRISYAVFCLKKKNKNKQQKTKNK